MSKAFLTSSNRYTLHVLHLSVISKIGIATLWKLHHIEASIFLEKFRRTLKMGQVRYQNFGAMWAVLW